MAHSHGDGAGTDSTSGTRCPSSLDAAVAANLRDIRQRIERAAQSAGREPNEVRLIAVSKTFSIDHVRAAAAAGQLDFGENRVQDGLQKCTALADLSIRWHLIGHVQSNKARKAIGPFEWIHSIDRVELLQRLERAANEAGVKPNLLIQVDLAREAAKHGAPPPEVRRILEAATGCRAVSVRGLMLMPPFAEPEGVRPFFRRLRELRDELVAAGTEPTFLRHLSMGMSHDFEVAIQEGSTMVRIGTAIFGARPRPVPDATVQ